jgi:hypothetical protein
MLDNKNIQKIFSLGDIRKKQLLGEVPERTRETYREYGYVAGGNYTRSAVDRIDYSNDTQTTSVRGPLTTAGHNISGAGNSNYGWFGGIIAWNIFISRSTIHRIDYSNDSATASVRGPLSLARSTLAATGNSNFGYFGGGRIDLSGRISNIDRIDYSNDITNTLFRGVLTQSKENFTSTSNSNFGWFGGGYQVPSSRIEKLNFLNDTLRPLVRGSFSSGGRFGVGATGNSNFGYFGGGSVPGSPIISSIRRIDYSNDLVNASVRSNLSILRSGLDKMSATGNSNFGYFVGGQISGLSFSTIERLDYSNDTTNSIVRGPTPINTHSTGATSSHSFGGSPNSSFASNFTFPTVPNAGYFGGGTDGTNNLATIDKVDYANDTATASVRSSLSSAKNSISAIGNSNFGYFAGGISPGLTTVDRLEYSSDTQNTSTRTNLQTTLTQSTAVGNESFGYFSGANTQIQKIDYSNDSTSIVGNIDDTRQLNASTSTRNFGYFSAGDIPEVSIIQRINFSNDTANALFRTNHAFNRRQHGGVGNETYGYFGGGVIAGGFSTLVERLDYSNDTTQPNIRGPLSLPRRGYLGATGSQNFGYFSGGDVPGPTYFSTTDRINYSNDTAVASIRGPLSTAKGSGAASSPLAYGGAPIYFTNPLPEVLQKQIEFDDSNTLDLPFKRVLGSYGYFGGGGLTTRVDRIDYSNDTSTASVRGSLQEQRERAASTGTNSYGYIAMGRSGNPIPVRNTYQRNDYSNDTANFIIRGSFNLALIDPAATGNSNFGYFGGGSLVPGSAISSISRLDYSTDNTTPPIRSFLSQNTYILAATGNSNFGYFGGGLVFPSPIYSTVNRLNYSTDTATTSVRGPLSLARQALAATGNSNFGYFGGGSGPVSTVERIDYSNDTATASVRGPLSLARFNSAATGNSNFGYFGGGSTPGPSSRSTVERIDYSNDTETASVRGPLSLARQSLAATTNARNS